MRSALIVIDRANRVMGATAAWCALAMMLFQVAAVLLRYVFSYGLVTFQEAVVYCHAILFMLGAAYVLQVNEHVRVDVLYNMMSPAGRRIVDLVGLIAFVLPVCAVVGWFGLPYVARAWATLEGSRQAGGIPAIFLLKTSLVVFAVSVALQAAATAFRLITGAGAGPWQTTEPGRPAEQG